MLTEVCFVKIWPASCRFVFMKGDKLVLIEFSFHLIHSYLHLKGSKHEIFHAKFCHVIADLIVWKLSRFYQTKKNYMLRLHDGISIDVHFTLVQNIVSCLMKYKRLQDRFYLIRAVNHTLNYFYI